MWPFIIGQKIASVELNIILRPVFKFFNLDCQAFENFTMLFLQLLYGLFCTICQVTVSIQGLPNVSTSRKLTWLSIRWTFYKNVDTCSIEVRKDT